MPRLTQQALEVFVGEKITLTALPIDSSGSSVDLQAVASEVVVQEKDGTDVYTVVDGSLTKTATQVSWVANGSSHTEEAEYDWALRDASTQEVYAWGPYVVCDAAKSD